MSERFGKADHNPLGIRELEIPFSPLGIPGLGGRQAFFDKTPVERVYPVHAENYAHPTMVGAPRLLAKIDEALAGPHRREGSIRPPVLDLEAQPCIEGHRLGHIAHGQSHRADVVEAPGWHDDMPHLRRDAVPPRVGEPTKGYLAAAVLSRADAQASATFRLGSAVPGKVAQPAFMTKSVCS